MSAHLVLFDIDGTLTRRAGPHHKHALETAAFEVTGHRCTLRGIPTSGMLDCDLIEAMLLARGLPRKTVSAHLPTIMQRAQAIYDCPDLHRRVCPGVVPLLRRLKLARIPVGLVTGNLTSIAWRKMEQARLRPYLHFGAFAEMAKTRADLARIAIAHARKQRLIGRNAQIALVGDHFNDIEAAKLNGIRSIAVATGVLSLGELVTRSPDLAVSDLRSLSLDQLFGTPWNHKPSRSNEPK